MPEASIGVSGEPVRDPAPLDLLTVEAKRVGLQNLPLMTRVRADGVYEVHLRAGALSEDEEGQVRVPGTVKELSGRA